MVVEQVDQVLEKMNLDLFCTSIYVIYSHIYFSHVYM